MSSLGNEIVAGRDALPGEPEPKEQVALPPEILTHIMEFFGKDRFKRRRGCFGTLNTLLRASKTFYALALPILYRTLDLSYPSTSTLRIMIRDMDLPAPVLGINKWQLLRSLETVLVFESKERETFLVSNDMILRIILASRDSLRELKLEVQNELDYRKVTPPLLWPVLASCTALTSLYLGVGRGCEFLFQHPIILPPNLTTFGLSPGNSAGGYDWLLPLFTERHAMELGRALCSSKTLRSWNIFWECGGDDYDEGEVPLFQTLNLFPVVIEKFAEMFCWENLLLSIFNVVPRLHLTRLDLYCEGPERLSRILTRLKQDDTIRRLSIKGGFDTKLLLGDIPDSLHELDIGYGYIRFKEEFKFGLSKQELLQLQNFLDNRKTSLKISFHFDRYHDFAESSSGVIDELWFWHNRGALHFDSSLAAQKHKAWLLKRFAQLEEEKSGAQT